jgi:FkbM family methyltransferase
MSEKIDLEQAVSRQTLISIVNHILHHHSILAPQIEQLASLIQGKGYGASTIEQENKLVRGLLKREMALAVDMGGNVGDYSAELRRNSESAEIHIFEPSAVNVDRLSLRFRDDDKVKVVACAVSDATGSATLFSNELGSGLGSLSQRRLEHLGIEFKIEERINTLRFEDYWNTQLDRRKIDLVKIDIEGHELAALNGLGDAILSTRVVQFEFGGCNIDTRTYFKDFWSFFSERGFELHRVSPFGAVKIVGYREADECFTTTNYIAVNKQEID